MTVLTEGRFELGIGAGLPRAATAAVEELGLPLLSPRERLTAISEAIDHLRTLDGDTHTPVLVAAGGPRSRVLAAEKADIVTLATPPLTPRAELAGMVTEIRSLAGHRAEQIELCMNLFVIGEQVPPWAEKFIGANATTLIAHDSLTMLRGTTQQMTDELQRRRDQLGISYICVNAAFHEQLAPVVEALNGR